MTAKPSHAWRPGLPLVTEADVEAWKAWRLERKRESQRHRRSTYRRIDYWPERETAALIDAEIQTKGGTYSAAIDRLILRGPPE